jgi:outer membrane lipoprotein SlyB
LNKIIINWLKNHRTTLIGILIGAVGGFIYWKFVGCSSGTCPITSSPVNSTIYGAIVGGLLGSSFKKKKKTDN